MLTTIKNKIIKIEPGDVLKDARKRDLDVNSIEDFRKQAPNYDRIEGLMEYYRTSHARMSILGGLTTGIGGITTAATFAAIDTALLAIQLYRLSQRFAILNGFDGSDPLQKDKMLNIYFGALSINGLIQASLKHQMLKAHAFAGSGKASNSLLLKSVVRTGRIFGKNTTSKQAGRLIPVVGGLIGATVNYSYARKTSQKMKRAYKRAYFEERQ